jgi:uncharacterized protein YdaL
MKRENVYMTRDLASAVYIAYNGVKFASNYDVPNRSWVFQDPKRCEELDLQLRNGEATVEVTKYESARRNLLGMVKDAKAGEGSVLYNEDTAGN